MTEKPAPMADGEPSVLGSGVGQAPIPIAEEAWMGRYVAQMVKRGIHPDDAWRSVRAGDHDYTDSPEDAADEELTYWDDDGD